MIDSKIIKALYNHFIAPKYPICGVLYLTNNCNLKCSFCEIGIKNRNREPYELLEIDANEIDLLIDAFSRLDLSEVYITGGEPFLSKNLWYLLAKCHSRHIRIEGITTNGSILPYLDRDKINILNQSGVRSIIISIDHATADKHDFLRGKENLFADIESFLSSKTADCLNPKFIISTVVNRHNYKEIPEIISWCSRIGRISHINFQPVCSEEIFPDMQKNDTFKSNYQIYPDEINELYRYIKLGINCSKTHHISTNLHLLSFWIGDYFKYSSGKTFFFSNVLKKHHCSKPYNYIHVNYNGDVLACTHIGPLFNIKDDAFADNWKTNAAKYRKLMRDQKYFEKCKYCFCDFPHNFRYSLIYSPISNINVIAKILPYYLKRIVNK